MNTSVFKNHNSKKMSILFVLILFVVIAVATVFFAAPQTTALAYTSTDGGSMSAGNNVSVSLPSTVAVKYYSFTPSTTATYEFYSLSNSGDPYFYLVSSDQLSGALSALNSAGRRTSLSNLTYNDDGNGSLNFKASYYCTAGTTYYLLFTRYSTSATSYTAYVSGTTRYTFTLNNQSATTAGTSTLYMECNGSSYNYIIGSSTVSTITIPTKTGYVFNGYYTSTNGGGTQVINSSGTILTAIRSYTTTTFYAYWTPVTYYLRYYPNGGSISSGTYYQQSSTYGTIYNYVTDSTAGISRTGYTFLGWSTDSGATSASYTSASTYSNLSTSNGGVINIYAVWSANNYSVRYYPNGGTISSGTYYQQNAAYGTTYNYVTNGAAGISKTGYTFLGWASSSSATSSSWTSADTFSNLTATDGGTVNRYAVWQANNYTVQYNINGGTSGSMADTMAIYDSTLNLRSNSFSRTDYNFLGWALDDEATVPDYTNAQSVSNLSTVSGDTVTLYAVWESDLYYITYALDGGIAGMNAPTQMNIGNIVNVSNPTREGYLFIGWTVTGADFNTSTAYYGLDDEDMDPLTSSLTKCGYFTNAVGTYFYDLSDTPDGAITLTANWLLDEFDVTFYDYDQTSVVEATAIYHYGNTVTAPAENPTRANDKSFSYSFLGWTPNGVNIYAPESLPTVGVQDVNYYAVYTRTYLYELTIGSTIVGSASGNPGDQITIEYFVSSNSGVSSLLLLFDYDSDSLDLVSAYTYDVSDPEAAFYYTSGYTGFYATPSGNINSVPYAIAWEGLPNHNGTGKLIRLVFEITETAGGGAYEIGLGIIDAATTNIALDSDSVAYRTYGTQGEFSDVKINYTPTEIYIQTDGTITIGEGQSKVYDGNAVTSGQFTGDIRYFYDGDGEITVTYYAADGTTVLGAPPVNVGTYWIGVSAAEGTYYNAVDEVKQQFTITPAYLYYTADDISTTGDRLYDGTLQTWTTDDITAYPANTTLTSVTGSWTNQGDYNLTVRLTADSNYTFSDTAGDYYDFSVPVSIVQATNNWDVALSCADITYGGTPDPSATPHFGSVSYSYSADLEGIYTPSMPSSAVGTYYVRATVEGNNNYTGLTATVSFEVFPADAGEYTGGDVTATDKVYTGDTLVWAVSDFTAPAHTSIQSVAIIGGQDYVNAGNPTITVTLQADSNYTFLGTPGDTIEVTVTLTILRSEGMISVNTFTAEYDGSPVDGSDVNYSYDGDGTVMFNWYSDNEGVRGESISAPTSKGNYWVGVYALQGNNYNAVAEEYAFFEIIPAGNEWIVELTIDDWTYGGTPSTPSAQALYQDIDEPTYTYRLASDDQAQFSATVPTEAGTYLVMATIEKTNDYDLLNAIVQFEILPALLEYTVSDISSSTSSKTYTGLEITWTSGEFTAPTYTTVQSVAQIVGQDYVNVGAPTITITLQADANHTFNTASGDTSEFTFTLAITQATNEWSVGLSIEDIIYGETLEPSATALFAGAGEPVYYYSTNSEIGFELTVPTTVGTYYVKAVVVETSNYTGLESAPVSFEILKATYDMSEIYFYDDSFVYDGAAHSIFITGVLPDGVSVNYSNNAQTDADIYTVTASFTGDGVNFNAISDLQATLTITPASLGLLIAADITAASKTYTGEILVWIIADFTAPGLTTVTGVETIVGQNYVNAGHPTITVTLTADDNYAFYGVSGDTKDFAVTLTIVQATNEWTIALGIDNITYGATPDPSATALFSDIEEPVYTYSTEEEGTYTASVPVNAGTYWVKATVLETSDYTGLTSEAVSFVINPQSLAALIAFDIVAESKTYTGLELVWVLGDFTAPANTSISNVQTIELEDYTNAGNPTITVTLLAGSNYTFYGPAGDTKDYVVTLTIVQATNEWTVVLSCEGIIYGGTLEPSATALFSGAGEPVYSYSADELGEYSEVVPTEVGSYWVKAVVAETSNYTGLIAYAQFAIGSLTVTKPSVVGMLTYNSEIQSPNIAGSARYTITGNTGTNAGNYTATVVLVDKENTTWADETTADLELSWSIAKAAVTFTADNKSSVYYAILSVFTYSTTGTVYNSELSPYVTSDVTQTSPVDDYVLVMNCEQDVLNNYTITLVNGVYTVTQAAITLTADDKSSQYSDEMVELTYQITVGELYGMDNLNVTLVTLATSLSNAGDYTITIGASNGNYDITLIDGTYTIALKVLTQGSIVINAADKPYTGEAITWGVQDITLTGATFTVITYDPEQDYTDVGEYTLSVTATSCANYTFNQNIPAVSGDIMGIIVTVQIVQAENAWIVELSVAGVTYGTALDPSAQAQFQGVGEPSYMYSTTQEGVYSTDIPTTVGTYWIKAVVAETLNYTGLESNSLEFTIAPYYVQIPQLVGLYTYNKTAQTVEEFNNSDSNYYTSSGTPTATNAGNYSVTYTLKDIVNTLWGDTTTESKVLVWTIERSDISLVADNKNGDYGDPVQELTWQIGFGTNFDSEIVPELSSIVTVESPVGDYEITITAENDNYNITLINGIYTIDYATYDMSGITFEDGTFTYDSTAKYIYITGTLPTGVTVQYIGNGQIQANADPGYTVRAEFTGNENYNSIQDMQATLYINKASISFTADNKSSAYATDLVALTATTVGTNYDGIVPTINTVATALSDANTYEISISVDEAYYLNYNISLTNGIYTITQAENYWEIALACSDVYYGNTPSPSATAHFQAAGEPVFTYSTELEGVYTSTVPASVNNYFVKATVLETINYSGLVATLEFNIFKATISTAGFSFEDLSVTYNSTAQYIFITGEIPNGVIVNYINNSLTNVGEIEATAQFTIPDPDNFNAIPDMTATLTVTPAPIALTADDKSTEYGETLAELTFTVTVGTNYNNEIVPMLNTIATSLSDVGSYEITITAMDTNYDITLINGTYSITQAENSWVLSILANDSVYGSALSISATPRYGTAVFYFSTDPEIGFDTIEPTLVNTYYVRATVEEDLNYGAITSATVDFNIIKATLSEPVLSYDGGTVTWEEVTTTINGLIVSGVTYMMEGAPNASRSYSASAASEGFTIISIPADTDNYAESTMVTLPAYSLEFSSAYGVAPATQYIFSGFMAVEPSVPVSNTHTFTRWKESISNNTWVFPIQSVENNTVIIVEWTASTFNVYYYDGETNITLDLPAAYNDYKTYTYGSGWTFLLSAPYVKTGHTFNYWADSEGVQVVEITNTQYGDLVVYTNWLTNQYSITYYSSYDGDAYEYLNIQYYNYGDATSALAIPDELTYFRYEYWYSDTERETSYVFTTMPAANVSLYGAFVWDIGLGDVNGDGTVDTDDITIYRQWLVGGYYTEIILAVPEYDGDIILRVADINDDGCTDIRDVSSIRMSIVGGYGYVIKDFLTESSVTGEEISTAVQYTATFKDYDGTTLSTYTTEHLRSAVAPADPERVGYTFTGWDTDFSSMIADITVTATYSINQYTATFKDYDGETLVTSTVDYLTSAVAPADPERVGYTFIGWDTDYSSMTGDITVTATYTINQYTATFKDYDDETLGTSTVDYLTSAVAPADPERVGYTFTGWDTDFSSMTADITVTATYEPN